MTTDEERIQAALASGTWKERFDPNRKKTYYVNVKTRKSVWNLIAELNAQEAQAAQQSHHQPSAKQIREDRQERLKRKAEAVAELKASVASLEQKKVEMEAEIARLKAPVEQETKQIQELRMEVGDMKFGLRVVENETSEKRKARDAELKAALSKVESLKSQVEAEKQHRNNIELRRKQLTNEALDLKTDLHKEQLNTEALKASVRAAEKKLDEAKREHDRQELDIAAEEEAVRRAEADLQALARKKNEMQQKIEKASSDKAELMERIQAAKNSNEQQRGQNRSNLLQQLTQKYETKRRTLKALSQREESEEDAKMLEHSNFKLRQLISSANRDAEALQNLSQCLEVETKRVKALAAKYREELVVARGRVETHPKTIHVNVTL